MYQKFVSEFLRLLQKQSQLLGVVQRALLTFFFLLQFEPTNHELQAEKVFCPNVNVCQGDSSGMKVAEHFF